MANIKVFARLKPCKNIKQELFKREDQSLYIASHKQVETDATVDSRTVDQDSKHFLRFSFAHVFGVDSSQKHVFQVAAKDIIEAFLKGYNGTIFAYGQTGAGKTYTIQGPEASLQDGYCGNNGCEDVGLIPRSLSLIFQKIRQHNKHATISLHISFFEIYRETAYDLLGCLLFSGSSKSKELPKILITMGLNGSCHLHGLSCHNVTSEKEALTLYRRGLANRKTACTNANQRSSRSHSIFTVALVIQELGSEIILRSKLHLVDLAGSERSWKSNAVEQIASRAKFINLSLYHLDSVIIALQKFHLRNIETRSKNKQTVKCFNRSSSAVSPQRRNAGGGEPLRMNTALTSASTGQLGRRREQSVLGLGYDPVYVPYRNSLLTMVLHDSLGGNCNAAMLAALSLTERNLRETILTCRFSQKVGRVVNEPRRNLEVDKDVVIGQMQIKLGKLQEELTTYKAHAPVTVHRDPRHVRHCVNVVRSFLKGRINDPVAHGINSPWKVRTTLRYMRQVLNESSANAANLEDEALDSSDDRDSGLLTGSEPSSPLASDYPSDCTCHAPPLTYFSLAHVPSHRLSFTQDGGVSVSTDDMVVATTPPRGPGKSEASTQTIVPKTLEQRKRSGDTCTEEERVQPVAHSPANLWISELELQKRTLLNKSKMIESRLIEQRARRVMMSKQGAVPEELENENIVQMQLLKKQRNVKEQLSLVMKELADSKRVEQMQQSVICIQEQVPKTKEEEPSTCISPSSQQIEDSTRPSKELELREAFTRQKLLACREQMKNLGISFPKIAHGRSRQSTASVSCQASISRASLMTLGWQCHGRENETRCSSTQPSSKTRPVVKPPRLKSTMNEGLPQVNKTGSLSRSASLQRRFSNPGRIICRPSKCLASRGKGERSPLVEYINKSHKAMYHNSTFPRRFGNSVQVDLSELNITSRKTTGKPGTKVAGDKTCFPDVSRGGCEQVSECFPAKAEVSSNNFTNDLKERSTCASLSNQTELARDHESESGHKNLRSVSDAETAASQPRKQAHTQDSLSPIRFIAEQRNRVKRIRECVKSAVVIQRSWRLYKKHAQ